jgi:hypothetical protein
MDVLAYVNSSGGSKAAGEAEVLREPEPACLPA